MNKIYNFLFRFQTTIFGLAIFLSFLAVSVHIDKDGTRLAWQNQPFIAVLVISAGLFMFLLYMWIDNYQIRQLSKQIQQQETESVQVEKRLTQLTDRQREVYELIVAGKSNKEIIAELYIEQSTLKTHINQIYKKLEIKSRRELKSLDKL